MPHTPSTCPLDCPDACGVLVETDERGELVRVRGNPEHSWSRGVLCKKTSVYADVVRSPDRLLAPLVRGADGELRPASWDAALQRIAERVRGLPGESILAAWYAGTMGLVQRGFPLRTMHALGATFVDGGLCDSASTAGYETVLGEVIGPDIEQADECDLLVLWGCDARRTVQHLLPTVQRLTRAGVPVIAVDVYRTDTIRSLERWGGKGFLIRPGSDAALALGLARMAYERGDAAREFLAQDCLGAEAFEAHVRAGHDARWTCETTGLEAAELEELARLLGAARRPFLKTGVGWTRRRNGAMSMRAVCSLAAVHGVADSVHYESSDHFQVPEEVVRRSDLRPGGGPAPQIRHVELGRELLTGRFRAVFVWGHNPAVTCPDEGRVREGLAREDVFVVVHEHFLTESARLADVVLPATTFVEHADLYKSYGHRVMQAARAACSPPPGPRSNVDAFAAIARALELPAACWEPSDEDLLDELLDACRDRVGEEGLRRLRTGEPVKLDERPFSGKRWRTPSGLVELESAGAAARGQPAMATYVPDAAEAEPGSFWLHCAPSVFTHNSTFSHSARHLRRAPAPTCSLHPLDAGRLELAEGDPVLLSNRHGELTLPLALDDGLPRGMVRVDGLPRAADTAQGVGVNVLVAPEVSDLGDGNTVYSTRVDLRPAAVPVG